MVTAFVQRIMDDRNEFDPFCNDEMLHSEEL